MNPSYFCESPFEPRRAVRSKKARKKKNEARKSRRYGSDTESVTSSSSSFEEVTYPDDRSPRRRSPKCPFGTEAEGVDDAADEEGLIVKRLYEGPRRCKCCTNWQSSPPAAVVKQVEKTSIAGHALTVYYSTIKNGDDTTFKIASIAVRSTQLKELLKEVLDDLSIGGKKPYKLYPPFKALYRRWSVFTAAKDSISSDLGPRTREEAQALFEFVEPEISDIIKERSELVPRGVITHNLLWTLYPIGCIVFSNLAGAPHMMTVSGIFDGINRTHINLEYRNFFGSNRDADTAVIKEVNIKAFSGVTPIDSLDAIPCDLHPKAESLTKTLIERGRRAVSMKDGSCWMYKGPAEARGSGPIWVDGRIIIDEAEYSKTNFNYADPWSAPPPPPPPFPEKLTGVDPDCAISLPPPPIVEPQLPKPRTDIQLAQCSSVLRGFSLETKTWASFDVDKISEMVWNDQAFDQLVMSNRRKRLIHALVDRNTKRNSSFEDFIKGKGKLPPFPSTFTHQTNAPYRQRPNNAPPRPPRHRQNPHSPVHSRQNAPPALRRPRQRARRRRHRNQPLRPAPTRRPLEFRPINRRSRRLPRNARRGANRALQTRSRLPPPTGEFYGHNDFDDQPADSLRRGVPFAY